MAFRPPPSARNFPCCRPPRSPSSNFPLRPTPVPTLYRAPASPQGTLTGLSAARVLLPRGWRWGDCSSRLSAPSTLTHGLTDPAKHDFSSQCVHAHTATAPQVRTQGREEAGPRVCASMQKQGTTVILCPTPPWAHHTVVHLVSARPTTFLHMAQSTSTQLLELEKLLLTEAGDLRLPASQRGPPHEHPSASRRSSQEVKGATFRLSGPNCSLRFASSNLVFVRACFAFGVVHGVVIRDERESGVMSTVTWVVRSSGGWVEVEARGRSVPDTPVPSGRGEENTR